MVSRILLIDDHPIFCQGIAALLAAHQGLTLGGEASTRAEALELLGRKPADLVIVDLSLGNDSGLELIKDIKVLGTQTRILVLSMHDELVYAARALSAGADGYVQKTEAPMKVIEAIHGVLQGKKWFSPAVKERLLESVLNGRKDRGADQVDSLTDREFEVFNLIGRGWGSTRIAAMLGLSVRTIDTHKDHLKQKLDCKDTQELRIKAFEWTSRSEK